jgi:UDP:flavonoid glycosyltransferase YjiC (YdhE family)
MRVRFSSTPAYGHLLSLLPLARALRERGHEVAVLSAETVSPIVAPEEIELLPAGPGMDPPRAEPAPRIQTSVRPRPRTSPPTIRR